MSNGGPRPAVIGTCTLSPYEPHLPEELFADDLSVIDAMAQRAAAHGWSLDLAVLPETFAQRWSPTGAESAEPIGREIARTTADRDPIVVQVDLEYRVVRRPLVRDYGRSLKEKYADRLCQDWHYEEHMCLLTSQDPELPIDNVMQCEELVTHREELMPAVPLRNAARGGPPPGGGDPRIGNTTRG